MQLFQRSRTAADALLLAAGLAILALLALKIAPFTPDDAYISYRYAERLAAGEGLRFNLHGPPVEGYSNFLWIVWLAALARAGGDVPTAATLSGAALAGVSLWLLWAILRRQGADGAALALPVLLLSFSGPVALYAVSGLETAAFLALLLLALYCFDGYARAGSAGWALGLALAGWLLALCRPEGVVAFPALAAGAYAFERKGGPTERPWYSRRAPLLAAVLLFSALLALYTAGRLVAFESLLPTPFLSKGGSAAGPWAAWHTNLRFYFAQQTHHFAPLGYYYAALGLAAGVGAAGAWSRRREYATAYAALGLALLYALVYVNFVDWMPAMRYFAPLVGPLLLAYGLFAHAAVGPGRGAEPGARLLVGGLLLLASLHSLALARVDGMNLQRSTAASLSALGLWLKASVPADSLLAIGDVGAAPYYSGLETFDIHPEALLDPTIAARGWSNDYFFAVDPDVVALAAFSLSEPAFRAEHRALYAAPRFQETYRHIGVVRNDWHRDRAYWIFVRHDLALAPDAQARLPKGVE